MENQHRHIKGYRELSQAEVDLMNEIKAKGEELKALVDKVSVGVTGYHSHTPAGETTNLEALGERARWVAIARTDFQTGLMALTRAVAQPSTF